MSGSNAVPGTAGELLELADRLHSCVEQLRAGESHTFTTSALSRLVTDTAHLYVGACQVAGREIDVAPDELSATDAVMLIGALMRAQNLNTFDLALWRSQSGGHSA